MRVQTSEPIVGADDRRVPLTGRIRALYWVSTVTWLGFAVMYAVMARPRIAAIDALAAAATAVIGWALLRPSRPRPRAAGHTNVAIASASLCAAAMVSGQDQSMAVWYLTVMPLLAAFVGGIRGAVVWTIVDAALIVGIHVSARVAPIASEFTPTGAEVAGSHVMLLALILVGAILYRRVNDVYVVELEQRGRVIAMQAEAAALQSRRLSVARDRALAAARTQSQFLANTSHELRTPLNGVVGLSQLLRETEPTAEQAELIDVIHASGRALIRIVDDLLDLSKIESGNMLLDVHPVDLEQLVAETVTLYRAQAEAKGLAVRTSIAPDVPALIAHDGTRIRQVLANLLSNAVKFTESGHIAVAVTCSEPNRIELSVSDTGIGIERDVQDSLFEPFVQADASTTRRYGGTGLGLAIVEQLARLLGGSVSVDSAPGSGATFRVSFEATPLETFGHRALLPATAPPPATPLRPVHEILVAEDNPTNVIVVQRMLARRGYAADVVHNGREAVERAANGNYDAILMDVHMPEMDGLRATRQIRALGLRKRPYIIALTASVLGEQREQCEIAGMDDFVAKPIDLDELVAALARASTSASPAEPSPRSIDRFAQLRQLFDDDESLADATREHVAHAQDLLAEIVAGLEARDAARALRAAHSLKSSSAQFGSDTLSEVCARIEHECRHGGSTSHAAHLVGELEAAFDRARSRLYASIAASA